MRNGSNFVEELIYTIRELKDALAEELGDTQDKYERIMLRNSYEDEIAWLKENAARNHVGNVEFEALYSIA